MCQVMSQIKHKPETITDLLGVLYPILALSLEIRQIINNLRSGYQTIVG